MTVKRKTNWFLVGGHNYIVAVAHTSIFFCSAKVNLFNQSCTDPAHINTVITW